MRFWEFEGGINLPVTAEESSLIEKIGRTDDSQINKDDLSSRELELARQMVSKGLLARGHLANTTYYRINTDKGWRN